VRARGGEQKDGTQRRMRAARVYLRLTPSRGHPRTPRTSPDSVTGPIRERRDSALFRSATACSFARSLARALPAKTASRLFLFHGAPDFRPTGETRASARSVPAPCRSRVPRGGDRQIEIQRARGGARDVRARVCPSFRAVTCGRRAVQHREGATRPSLHPVALAEPASMLGIRGDRVE